MNPIPSRPAAAAQAHDDTLLVHAGRAQGHSGAINVPVYQASTILFPTLDAYEHKEQAPVRYGRRGTPTSQALEQAISGLEQAEATLLTPSGLSAVTTTLLAHASPGAHLLVSDAIYPPARQYCAWLAQAMGVRTTFYDPLIGAGIVRLFTPDTRLIWLESPGSHTFEIQDVAAITQAARAAGITTAIDNSWSGGYFFKPMQHGVDIVVHALTKYIGGHSDLLLGAISSRNAAHHARIKTLASSMGLCAGSQDIYLALRGFRTLATRMDRHYASALRVARWLEQHPAVARVIHPALPSHPQHEDWQRQFSGASGLFSFIVHESSHDRLAAMLDQMHYFGMGSSWGGYDSLLIPSPSTAARSYLRQEPPGRTLRIHVGLEHPDDLIADLEQGLCRLTGSPGSSLSHFTDKHATPD